MSLKFSTQGAHVFHWQPATFAHPILFCSEKAYFEKGKSIRGGIPICWPWFGPKSGYMQHGFARTIEWLLLSDDEINNSRIIKLKLIDTDISRENWNHRFELTLNIITTDSILEMELITKNIDSKPFEISQALHTYFYVEDINEISIEGLNGTSYIDKVDNATLKTQNGNITFKEETDRIYLSNNEVSLIDNKLNRKIILNGEGISSWVIWNPWSEKVKTINDMADHEYRKFVCIEAANADKPISIDPDEEYKLYMKIAAVCF